MNATELRYRNQFLAPLEAQGAVVEREPKLHLAHRCDYSPDFGVTFPDGRVEYHEVKGAWYGKAAYGEDGWLKFKFAAALYRDAVFVFAKLSKGQWAIQRWRDGAPVKEAKGKKR